jgi:hypothetical protein
MMYVLIMFTALLYVGCTTQSEKKIVDFEQIRPKTTYSEDSSVILYAPKSDALWAFNHDSVRLDVQRVDTITTGHFLDRFNAVSKRERKILTTKKDNLQFRRWEFPDSIRRKNAQFNWLDHFGDDNINLRWLSSTKISHGAVVILFNTRSILEIKGQEKIEVSKWIAYQKTHFPKDSMGYLLEQAPGKKCQWYKRTSSNTIAPCKPQKRSIDPI